VRPIMSQLEFPMYRQQTVGAPFKPFFGLSGITRLSTREWEMDRGSDLFRESQLRGQSRPPLGGFSGSHCVFRLTSILQLILNRNVSLQPSVYALYETIRLS